MVGGSVGVVENVSVGDGEKRVSEERGKRMRRKKSPTPVLQRSTKHNK